jgi:hypothetical protein
MTEESLQARLARGDLAVIRDERLLLSEVVDVLKTDWPAGQLAAAEVLVQHGAASVEPLLSALEHPRYRVPLLAAKALGDIGDVRAMEPLIRALEHPDPRVQHAAAHSLGQIGDLRAVEPLLGALYRFGQGRPRWQLYAVPIQIAAGFAGLCLGGPIWGVLGLAILGSAVFSACLVRFGECRPTVVVQALERISQANSEANLRALLPDLQAVAADRVLQPREAREAARRTCEQIEALTAAVKDLPRPASSDREADALPRAGPAPVIVPERLPVPAPEHTPATPNEYG